MAVAPLSGDTTPAPLPTGPKVIPWIEVNSFDGAGIETCIEGLRLWKSVTDTVIVSTMPDHAVLFRRLKERVPDLHIIAGLKTYPLLNRFDSKEGWQAVARNVAAFLEATGESRILLENETALKVYTKGDEVLDLAGVRSGLALLPRDVRVIWYPAVHGQDERTQRRLEALCRVVAEQCDVQFVDLSLDGPRRLNDEWAPRARRTLKSLSRHSTIPILYCYGDDRWWRDEQIPQALRRIEDDAAILYPGAKRWLEAAHSLTGLLRREAPSAP
jgi:hypothetical protein